MSIATAIQNAQWKVANAYTAVSTKGGTLPATQNLSNLPTAINSIPTQEDIGVPRVVDNGVYKMPTQDFTFTLPDGATDLGNFALNNAFRSCPALKSIDFNDLTTVSGNNALQYAFLGCSGLTSIDLSGLTTISGNDAFSNAFYSCTNLTSADLSGLTTATSQNAVNRIFYACTKLESVSFSNLVVIGNQNATGNNYAQFAGAFYNTKITTLTFPKLEKIYCTGGATATFGTFNGNNKIEKMYFPKLDTITYGNGATSTYQNACKYIFSDCNLLTELHFASANQSAIQATTGYSTKWWAPSTCTIYFDL